MKFCFSNWNLGKAKEPVAKFDAPQVMYRRWYTTSCSSFAIVFHRLSMEHTLYPSQTGRVFPFRDFPIKCPLMRWSNSSLRLLVSEFCFVQFRISNHSQESTRNFVHDAAASSPALVLVSPGTFSRLQKVRMVYKLSDGLEIVGTVFKLCGRF